MEKREPIAEIKEKVDAMVIKEFNQNGAVVQYNSSGEVKGRYHGIHMETTDVTFKMDGTLDWQARAVEATKEGDNIMITGSGTGMMQAESYKGNIRGQVVYMSNSSRLNWINNLRADVDGEFDMKDKELSMKIYLAMQQQVSSPAM
ncbi:MAG: hypothetical protein ACFCUE_13510 [Candidatus Bathyarchaeia archaeon]|jgi:hypothetical protein